MYRHPPASLRGPFTRTRAWWSFPDPEAKLTGDASSAVKDLRFDLVARVRREIAEGCYDTPDRWDAALERLFARLGRP